jgi:hypothetical protein
MRGALSWRCSELKRAISLVAIAAACAVSAYAWYRASRFTWISAPHKLAWYDANDRRLESDSWCRRGGLREAFVVGERIIVNCGTELLWMDPARGKAKVTWAFDGYEAVFVEALAIHPDERWAIAFSAQGEGGEAVGIAVAGKDGWIVPPYVLGTKPARVPGTSPTGSALALGLAWRGDMAELVLTRPTGDDEYGVRNPPELVRVGRGITRTPLPMPCNGCTVMGALPAQAGWHLVALTSSDHTAVVLDENGKTSPAPPALAWWEGYAHLDTDRTSVGITRSEVPEPVMERDGSRHPIANPPVAGFKPEIGARYAVEGGVLRARRIWQAPGQYGTTTAQRIRGLTFIATRTRDGLISIGNEQHMHAVTRGASDTAFLTGELLPRRGGGHYWVAGDGKFVTLDAQLRRIDHLSLHAHLTERSRAESWTDTTKYVHRMLFAMAGLPFAIALGLILSLLLRRGLRLPPVAIACGIYALAAAYALGSVLPLL